MGRKRSAVLVGGLVCFAWLGAMERPGVADAACPNQERRAEQGAPALALPDCRAYELVSRGGLLSQDQDKPARASITGDGITFYTTFPAEGAKTSSYYYLSTRGSSGWSLQSIGPQSAPAALFDAWCSQNVYFSPDLSRNIDEEGWFGGIEEAHCKRHEKEIVPGEPTPYRNVFLHDVATGSYQLVNLTPPGATPSNARFQDASDNFNRILFSEEAKLTADAPSGYNLFLWEDGIVRLVTYLPNGTPVEGELTEGAGHRTITGSTVGGSGLAPVMGSVSADGTRVFFYAGSNLYMRENADQPQSAVSGGVCTESALGCTIQIDASQGPGASGGGNFWRASPDASRVLFTAERKLTSNSTSVSGKADLYRYDTESGQLIDLTVNAGEPADVRGVAGASEDGSHVYFAANGVLAPGASPGKCRGSQAAGQTCSLYHAHGGSIDLIGTVPRADSRIWQGGTGDDSSLLRRKVSSVRSNVSPSGRFFAFSSVHSLTGYDNRDVDTDIPTRQIFLYDADANGGDGELSCVSCIPSGARPDGNADIFISGSYGPEGQGGDVGWKINAVLDDGRVFFHTVESLVAEDTNSWQDVYQYEAGQHHLISTGTYQGQARFFDATPSGSDVFFRTPQSLVSSDNDYDNISLYDARVGGGFVEPSPSPPPCEGESCRDAVSAPPTSLSPSTATLLGPEVRPRRRLRKCRQGKRRQRSRKCSQSKRRRQAKRRTGVSR